MGRSKNTRMAQGEAKAGGAPQGDMASPILSKNSRYVELHRSYFTQVLPLQIQTMAFSPDGKYLAVGLLNNSISVYSTKGPMEAWDLVVTMEDDALLQDGGIRAIGWYIESFRVRDHPMNERIWWYRLFSAGLDGKLKEWDCANRCVMSMTTSFGGGVWSMAINEFGLIALSCEDGSARIFNANCAHLVTLSLVDNLKAFPQPRAITAIKCGSRRVTAVWWAEKYMREETSPVPPQTDEGDLEEQKRFSYTGYLLTGDAQGAVHRWPVHLSCSDNFSDTLVGDRLPAEVSITVAQIVTNKKGGQKNVEGKALPIVWNVRCLSNGDIVTVDSYGSTSIWDGTHGTLLQSFELHSSDILALEVDVQRGLIYSAGLSGKVYCFAPVGTDGDQSFVKVKSSTVHTHDINSLCLSPSHKGLLVSGGVDASLVGYCVESVFMHGNEKRVEEDKKNGAALLGTRVCGRLIRLHRNTIGILRPSLQQYVYVTKGRNQDRKVGGGGTPFVVEHSNHQIRVWKLGRSSYNDSSLQELHANNPRKKVKHARAEEHSCKLRINVKLHVESCAISDCGRILAYSQSTPNEIRMVKLTWCYDEARGTTDLSNSNLFRIPTTVHSTLQLIHSSVPFPGENVEDTAKFSGVLYGLSSRNLCVYDCFSRTTICNISFLSQTTIRSGLPEVAKSFCMCPDFLTAAVLTTYNRIVLISLHTKSVVWCTPALDDPISAYTFQSRFNLIVSTISNQVIIYNVEAKRLSDWSRDNGIRFEEFQELGHAIESISAGPEDVVVFGTHSSLSFVNFGRFVPKSLNNSLADAFPGTVNPSRKRGRTEERSEEDLNSSANYTFETVTKFSNVLACRFLRVPEGTNHLSIAVIERPWDQIFSDLPKPVLHKKYGT